MMRTYQHTTLVVTSERAPIYRQTPWRSSESFFFIAFLSITEFAKIGRVRTATTSLVDERVIVGTMLVIVLALDVAFVNLEDLEVEVLYGARLTTFLRNSLEFVK